MSRHPLVPRTLGAMAIAIRSARLMLHEAARLTIGKRLCGLQAATLEFQ